MRIGPLVLFERRVIKDLDDGDPFMVRHRLFRLPFFGIFLHHILRDDRDRDMHDHPWTFISIVLWGGYVEERPYDENSGHDACMINGEWRTQRYRGPLSIAYRPAESLHRVIAVRRNTWTLVIPFGNKREWGFQTKKGWVHWSVYYVRKRRASIIKESG